MIDIGPYKILNKVLKNSSYYPLYTVRVIVKKLTLHHIFSLPTFNQKKSYLLQAKNKNAVPERLCKMISNFSCPGKKDLSARVRVKFAKSFKLNHNFMGEKNGLFPWAIKAHSTDFHMYMT